MNARPVRWGIISTAKINERVLPQLRDAEAVEVLAVASRSGGAADAYAAEWGIPRAHDSYEELLADPEIEAVYLPLPNSMHVEWSIRALQAGKHVLCEKPMDRRVEEVRHAFDEAERNGLILSEAFMYRHNPQTRQASALVAGGAVGELRLVRGSFGFVLDRPGDVRLNAELDGGALMDVGCYCVSGARLFCGEPEVAIGRQVLDPGGVDIRFTGSLAFPGEVLAHFDCGLDVPFTSFLEVVGSEGTLRLPSPFLIQEPGIELLREGESTERIEVEQAGSYRLEFEDIGAAIRGDGPPLLGREDAIGQARAIEALYRSAEAGGEPVPCAEVGNG